MKNSWEMKKLGEVCEIGAGNSAPQKKELFDGGTYPFFRTSDAGRIRFGVIYDSADKLNEIGIKKLHLYKKGTLLFPKSGASTFLNHRVLMATDGYVSSHLATLKAKDNILDDRFLFYFSSTIDSRNLMQDQNYPSLRLSDIQDINIFLPSFHEQKRIVKILDGVFEKITKAKENAEKNLQNARELFESYLQSIFDNPGDGWEEKNFEDVIEKITYTNKIHRKNFLESGKFPVVSQEKDLINGYWSNRSDIFKIKKPVVIFGDHTQILKYIDFDFVLGADGVKILQPKDFLYPKIFYYLLRNINLKSLGYARHYRLLKEKQILFPKSIPEQHRIVFRLDALSAETKKLEVIYQQKLNDLEELKKSILKKAFTGELVGGCS